MDFTPEDEEKFIREEVFHKLNIPIVNTSNKFWRESTQTKATTPPLQIGDSIR